MDDKQALEADYKLNLCIRSVATIRTQLHTSMLTMLGLATVLDSLTDYPTPIADAHHNAKFTLEDTAGYIPRIVERLESVLKDLNYPDFEYFENVQDVS